MSGTQAYNLNIPAFQCAFVLYFYPCIHDGTYVLEAMFTANSFSTQKNT